MENKNYYYPAIFIKSRNDKGYEIYLPDFENSATQGEDLDNAMYMARDYIGCVLYQDIVEGNELSVPSDLSDIDIEKYLKENELDEESLKKYCIEKGCDPKDAEIDLEKSFKTLVRFNPVEYMNNAEKRTVRRNVSLPYWLNEVAKQHNWNCSKILREALIRKLEGDDEGEKSENEV